MNETSTDIKDMLEGESSLGLTFGTNLFIGKEVDGRDNIVTIFDTEGRAPSFCYSKDDSDYFYSGIQIRVRNNTYQGGWQVIKQVFDFLQGKDHETWNGTYYQAILATSDIGFLGFTENEQAQFSVNFEVQRNEV